MTKRFIAVLGGKRREILENWASGAYTEKEGSGTVQLNAEALGRASQLNELMRIESDELRDAEEYFGTAPGGAPNRGAAD